MKYKVTKKTSEVSRIKKTSGVSFYTSWYILFFGTGRGGVAVVMRDNEGRREELRSLSLCVGGERWVEGGGVVRTVCARCHFPYPGIVLVLCWCWVKFVVCTGFSLECQSVVFLFLFILFSVFSCGLIFPGLSL